MKKRVIAVVIILVIMFSLSFVYAVVDNSIYDVDKGVDIDSSVTSIQDDGYTIENGQIINARNIKNISESLAKPNSYIVEFKSPPLTKKKIELENKKLAKADVQKQVVSYKQNLKDELRIYNKALSDAEIKAIYYG